MTRPSRRAAALVLVALVLIADPAWARDVRQLAIAANGLTVSAEELQQEIFLIGRSDPKAVAPFRTTDGLTSLVRTLLIRKLQAAEARRLSLDASATGKYIIQRVADVALAEELVRNTLGALDASERGARRYFEDHRDQFRGRPRRKVRHIVVSTSEAAEAAKKSVAEGASLEQLARTLNIDDTRATGGAIGWVHDGLMVKPFNDAVFALTVGQVSDVVQTTLGYHLITVEDIDLGNIPSFELIADTVVESMRRDALARLEERLWKQAAVTIDRAAIADVLKR